MKKLLFLLFMFPTLCWAALNLTNTSTISYQNDTENWNLSVTTSKDIVTTAPITGGANDILPGAEADVFINLTVSKDVVCTAPVTGGGDDILTGADGDIFVNLTVLKDIVCTAPITGGGDDVLTGADADLFINITNADDDDSTKGAATFNNTHFDATAGLVTIASDAIKAAELDVADVSDDIAADIAEGELANSIVVSADIKDGEVASADIAAFTIVAADVANTTLTDLKVQEKNFEFTVSEPDLLPNATGLPTNSIIVWTNWDVGGRTYTISQITSYTDVDNYNISFLKSLNTTNASAAQCTYLQNISVADNGEGIFYNNTTSFTNATIEAGKHLIFQSGTNINVTNGHWMVRGNFS